MTQFSGTQKGYSEREIKEYIAETGDKNPIHWDGGFFEKHPAYRRITGITAPIVPGAQLAQTEYRRLRDETEYKMKCRLWLRRFSAYFKKPLYFNQPYYFEYHREENGEGLEIKGFVGRMTGERLAHFELEFRPRERYLCKDHFAVSLPLAGIVWKAQGDGTLVYRVNMQFERPVKIEEEVRPEFSTFLSPQELPFQNKKKIQYNLQLINGTGEILANYLVKCRDCSWLLSSSPS